MRAAYPLPPQGSRVGYGVPRPGSQVWVFVDQFEIGWRRAAVLEETAHGSLVMWAGGWHGCLNFMEERWVSHHASSVDARGNALLPSTGAANPRAPDGRRGPSRRYGGVRRRQRAGADSAQQGSEPREEPQPSTPARLVGPLPRRLPFRCETLTEAEAADPVPTSTPPLAAAAAAAPPAAVPASPSSPAPAAVAAPSAAVPASPPPPAPAAAAAPPAAARASPPLPEAAAPRRLLRVMAFPLCWSDPTTLPSPAPAAAAPPPAAVPASPPSPAAAPKATLPPPAAAPRRLRALLPAPLPPALGLLPPVPLPWQWFYHPGSLPAEPGSSGSNLLLQQVAENFVVKKKNDNKNSQRRWRARKIDKVGLTEFRRIDAERKRKKYMKSK